MNKTTTNEYIVYASRGIERLFYHIVPADEWRYGDAVPYVLKTTCEQEAHARCKQLNDGAVSVYRPVGHPPKTVSTTLSTHVDTAKERYLSKHPDKLW